MNVCVLTATIGRPTLQVAAATVSVQADGTVHVVLIDGEEHQEDVLAFLKPVTRKAWIHTLPHRGAWGGPAYSWALSVLPFDVFLFCDDDNWLELDHVSACLAALDGKDWAFTYRRILNSAGVVLETRGREFFVDTNCYCLTKDIARLVAPKFLEGYRNDRAVYEVLKEIPHGCTERVTVNYTVR